ncbi:MAG TPA: methyltransferase domain-containing protein [Chthoniobacterales bacterium]
MGHLLFLQEFFKAASTTGAVLPSSPRLAELLVEKANVRNSREILELGPGEGVVSREILKAKGGESRFLAVEKNPRFVELLKSRNPEVPVIHGCGTRLAEHSRDHRMHSVDCVVSCLPWASFPPSLQSDILKQVLATLKPGGTFATFAYFGPHWLPAGQRFRKQLQSAFSRIHTSRIELVNFPPAFVYYSRR